MEFYHQISVGTLSIIRPSLHPTESNGCEGERNGDCSQLCLPRPGGRICRCTVGYKLAEDGTTCTGQYVGEVFCVNYCELFLY